MAISEEVEWPYEEDYCPPDDAKDIIVRLLNHNPVDRLGAGGVHEVKEHIFFEGLDWDGLLRQKAEFVPHLQNEEDTSYFDSMLNRLMNMISRYSHTFRVGLGQFVAETLLWTVCSRDYSALE